MDLLLTVETIDGATEYVYVLVEHKSYPASMVAVQLLGYIGGILKRYRKPPVPIIHPVVFYHGAKTWTAPTELTGLHQGHHDRRDAADPDAHHISDRISPPAAIPSTCVTTSLTSAPYRLSRSLSGLGRGRIQG